MTKHIFSKSKWADMDTFTQMGNIGSEVGRAFSAKRQGKTERCQTAFYRGLDLIDETARLWSVQKKAGLKELLYARELFAESIISDKVDPSIETYFNEFAVAAQLRRQPDVN